MFNSGCIVTGIPVGYPNSAVGYGGANGVSLSQTVSGLISGDTYVLEFWAGGEHGFTKKGIFAVDLGFGKTFFRDKSTAPVTGIGTRYLIVFNATSTSHTIKFTNWGHMHGTGGGSTELILDDLKLYHLINSVSSVCGVVGINETEENVLSVYPNPATSAFTVSSTDKIKEVRVYNVLGVMVNDKWLMVNSSSATIDLSGVSNGLYFAEIKTEKGIVIKKIIKQ